MENSFLGWCANYEDRCAEAYSEISKCPDDYYKILKKYELTEFDIPFPMQKFAF